MRSCVTKLPLTAKTVLTFLPALVLACLASAAKANEKIDCGYPLTQMEMTFCAQQSWEQADRQLNEVYGEALEHMTQMDSMLPQSLKGAADALKDAQRAWIPFRDKACTSYGFLARGGSMEPMLVYGCRTTLTKQRTEELKELVQGLGN
ncbi:lysozyme inhibitor LprI family protein [Roseibium sp. RKSG952]|uniref:lysozyme inhibitor LprI family protein n=1 Tax=Roseibium sp. RKSG952 TaxID=2529384 RepID=UPI0012BC7AAB|nr:lysozyme inhibitor LprI family protein [Roseibium sp. RKSG952]MTI01063.1 DUF1311 domain-containing protein [Roseibium sp. RKSG952]